MVPGITRYIDPLLDFSFKKIFGSEENKELLISLLNELFRGRKEIIDLVYGKNEHPGDLKGEGGAIFDVLCIADKGGHFLIEVQRGKQRNFMKRALFYAARQISGLAPKGKPKDWKYDFTEVYLIAILDDFTLAIRPPDQYLNDICLCDRYTGEIIHDEFGFIFIELLNFTKSEHELETNLDKWLYLLKNMSTMTEIPPAFQEPIFEKLFNIAEYSNLTKEEKMDHDRRQKYIWDNKNVMDYAIEEGTERGLETGKEIGREIGIQEGQQQKALRIAKELKKINLSVEMIAMATELPVEEVERL
ncbi:MAG TPA: Rpn family recombination-promoting nuclease/putative transposase [Pedobacter sp.]